MAISLGDRLNERLAAYLATARFARLAGDKAAGDRAVALLARGIAVRHAQAYYHQFLIEQGLWPALANVPDGFLTSDTSCRSFYIPYSDDLGLAFAPSKFSGARQSYACLLNLTPEVGSLMRETCRPPIEAALRYIQWRYPLHWLNRGMPVFRQGQGEEIFVMPWIATAGFLGQAFVVGQTPDELWQYIGHSRAKLGDLYYLQRLEAALSALPERRQ